MTVPFDPPMAWSESERLAALDRYKILDTGREARFDDIAELAADILDAPIAVVNFIAGDRQWFKAEKGIGKDSLPLDVSICRFALLQPGVFVVPDLTQDRRFDQNPLVNAVDGLRFYAGALLETPEGLPLGTVCVLDTKTRAEGITGRQERALKALAVQTMAQLELRRSAAAAKTESARLSAMFAQATVGMSEISLDGQFLAVNDRMCEILGRSQGEVLTLGIADLTHPEEVADNMARFAKMAMDGENFKLNKRYVRPDGSVVWANSSVSRLDDENGKPRAALVVTADITLAKEEERHRAFLLDMSDRTRGMNDAEAVISTVSRALGVELGATRVVYAEIDEVHDFAEVIGEWNDGTLASLPGTIRLSDFGAPIIDPLRAGTTLRVNDAATEQGLDASLAALATVSACAIVSVPLIKDGNLVVNLNVHQSTSRLWTDAEVRLIEAVAERTWDVVERARGEARVRESESRLRLATDNADIGFWDVDEINQTLHWPPRVKAMFGLSAQASASMQDFYEAVHPNDREAVSAAYAAAADPARRALYDAEFRVVAKDDGAIRWMAAKGRGVFDEDGRCLRVAGTVVDVTKRRNAEEALRSLNADLEREVVTRTRERGLIWQHSLDLLSVIDMKTGTFDAVNPAWEKALGWRTAEFEGRPYEEFVHPEDLGESADAFDLVQQGNPVLHFENRYSTRSGGCRWLSWVAVPDGGKLYSVTRDVTVERERRAELELAQNALRQAQKMEAMGQLTGGVAHDFNNLLTPIMGSLDMMMRNGLGNEREQRLISGAMQSAERAKTLVQRLLAFARRQPLQPVPADVAKLILGMADLIESTTGPNIRVSVEAADELPPALTDPNQLEMALLNLAVNARDAMPDGGTLCISASAETVGLGHPTNLQPGRYVRLSVADTGSGMDEGTIARAIEPFFSTKGVGKGTGLGLSMVHGLASQLGGVLTIDSKPGTGTDVQLWLPESAVAPGAAVERPGSTTENRPRGRALLVDDEALVRLSTADMLSDLGYAVIEAASGEEAMQLIDTGERFDLLVTDHLMPGITGTDLARKVRAAMPQVSILLVSGYAEREGVASDIPRLVKPFRKDELALSLDRLGTVH